MPPAFPIRSSPHGHRIAPISSLRSRSQVRRRRITPDGAILDANGEPKYCNFASAHWNVPSAQANPEVVAEVRRFLTHPVHFFAECQSVDAFENLIPYGHFLTPNGFTVKAQ